MKITAQTLKKSIKAAHHQRVQYHENIMEELENKFAKVKVAEPSKLTGTELEDKIEKKIEKRRQETEYEKNPES